MVRPDKLLLEQTVRSQSDDWLEECFRLMDRARGNSEGRKWNRKEVYNV